MMLVLLPLLAFAALLALARAVAQGGEGGEGGAARRAAFLVACLVWSALAVGITELLSLPRALTPGWIATAWGLVAVVASSAALVARRRARGPGGGPGGGPGARSSLERGGLAATDVVLLFGLALVLVALLVIALASPPNGWDTMSYHLPRTLHWIQNQGLIHFPAHDSRQLTHPPLAELIDLQFLALHGDDRFVSGLRLFFMVATLVGVSLVARQLGARVRGQVAAVVAAGSIPMHMLQTTVDKNDGVATFFLVCMVYYLLCLRDRLTLKGALAAGAALGLALLTKLTSYLFAFPFLVWLGLALIKRHRVQAWRPLAVLAVVPLVLNAGHFARNLQVFGHPLADPVKSERLGLQRVTLPVILSNAIRNVTLELNTPSEALNGAMKTAVVVAHDFLGVDPNDPATTSPAGKYEVVPTSTGGAAASNPAHFVLLIGSVVLLFTRRRFRTDRWLLGYTLALIGAAATMFALLKWQPTLARLHLPLLVLGAPVIAIVLTGLLGRTWSAVLFLGLLVSSGPWLLDGGDRALLGPRSIFRLSKRELYFLSDPGLQAPAHQAAAWIRSRGLDQVGLVPSRHTCAEYLLWLALSEHGQSPRIENVLVENNSSRDLADRGPLADFWPEVIIRVGMTSLDRAAIGGGAPVLEDQLEYRGVTYSKVVDLGRLGLYVPGS